MRGQDERRGGGREGDMERKRYDSELVSTSQSGYSAMANWLI